MSDILTTIVSGNAPYSDLIKVFLLSLNETGSTIKVIANVINGTEKHRNSISKLYRNVVVKNIAIENPTPIKILYSRPQQIMDCLDSGYDRVLSIDADVIFNAPIEPLLEDVVVNSIKFWDKGLTLPIDGNKRTETEALKYLKKKGTKIDTRFQGGVFALGNGPMMREYWYCIMNKIPQNPDGYCIQRILFSEIEFHKITQIPMSPSYNDSYFNDTSPMWHGKGGHRENNKWKNVFNKYLKTANNIMGEQ